ncbi:MAG: hypothetical protein JO307_19690 [Bryobacterales bacterium]|nr:hypothetical protein [Bryobacterales bacterium]MBV9401458.1 hypothetical protein [Bryobacterales bacterium]
MRDGLRPSRANVCCHAAPSAYDRGASPSIRLSSRLAYDLNSAIIRPGSLGLYDGVHMVRSHMCSQQGPVAVCAMPLDGLRYEFPPRLVEQIQLFSVNLLRGTAWPAKY